MRLACRIGRLEVQRRSDSRENCILKNQAMGARRTVGRMCAVVMFVSGEDAWDSSLRGRTGFATFGGGRVGWDRGLDVKSVERSAA